MKSNKRSDKAINHIVQLFKTIGFFFFFGWGENKIYLIYNSIWWHIKLDNFIETNSKNLKNASTKK